VREEPQSVRCLPAHHRRKISVGGLHCRQYCRRICSAQQAGETPIKAQARRDFLLFAAAGALPTLGCHDYQLNCSLRFISGWPPMLEVRWSALILANVFGLRKSTVVVGLLQA